MSETRKIICDECLSDLTYTGNCEDYYLVLTVGSKAPWFAAEGHSGGFLTAMAIRKPIDGTRHFCDLKCMDGYRDRERAYDVFLTQHWNAWKKEHGEKDDNGRVFSYPGPPEETHKGWKDESAAAALAKFPKPDRSAKK